MSQEHQRRRDAGGRYIFTALSRPDGAGRGCNGNPSQRSGPRRPVCSRLVKIDQCRASTDQGRRPLGVCAVKRRRFPVGASPTRQPLQPEAIGAVMEVTKWLKPSISVSRIADSASVQAATRVNVEQASKRTMCRPTRRPYRGRVKWLGEFSEEYAQL